MNLFVDEIFYGLQGEGNRMGFPSIFIRLARCNLKCEGFGCEATAPDGTIVKGCDTIHAVSPKFRETWEKYVDWHDLTEAIGYQFPEEMAYNEEQVDIIFTGGEPLLFHDNPILINTVKFYLSRGHRVWFETNATIPVDFNEFPIYKKCSMSMSVKMMDSGEPVYKRWKPEVAESYISNTENSYFKFVVGPESFDSIFTFLDEIPSYAPVYLMPKGATFDELKENAFDVYEFASEHGLRYSDRLHIRIHNDKRGV
jgi:organic radical activating enzyme